MRLCQDVCICLLARAENRRDYNQKFLPAADTDVTRNSYLWFLPALPRKQAARRSSARHKSMWDDAVLGSETGQKSICYGKLREAAWEVAATSQNGVSGEIEVGWQFRL